MATIKWTDEEVILLKKVFPSETWGVIAESFPNHTKEQIRHKAGKLKIHRSFIENCGGRNKDGAEYTIEEIEFIKENFFKRTINEIGRMLSRGYSSVANKSSQLNLRKLNVWSDEEVTLIKKVFPFHDIEYLLSNYFQNKTRDAVLRKAQKLGLLKSSKKINSKKIKKEYAIAKLKELSIKLGRTPIHSDLVSNGIPSLATYRLLFGNYSKACEAAGLLPNFSKIGVGRKSVLKSRNGDTCFSVYEEVVTNFFIDRKIKYEKEVYYSKYINDKRCTTKRADWVLFDGTFVEFWGFPDDKEYKENMKTKIKLCKKANIKLISLYYTDMSRLKEIFKKYIS